MNEEVDGDYEENEEGWEEEDDYEDWDLLEEPYDIVKEVIPKAPEAQIVRVLRKVYYDPELAILAIRKAKKLLISNKNAAKKNIGDGPASPRPAPGSRSTAAVPPTSPTTATGNSSSSSSSCISPGLMCLPPPTMTQEQASFLASSRPHISVVTLGHVDAGKSTLLGRLLYELGLVPERTLSRVIREAHETRKTSFAFAWLFDKGAEERARGITVDVGENSFSTRDKDFTLLDAPGHREFVPNMITGVAHADAAILVVDASPGEFEAGMSEGGVAGEGQTREHASLARALGVQQVVVAVNKMDSPGVGWSECRYRYVEEAMRNFLLAVGFARDRIVCVPVSGLTGVNLVKRVGFWIDGTAVGCDGEGASQSNTPPPLVSSPKPHLTMPPGAASNELSDLMDGLGLGGDDVVVNASSSAAGGKGELAASQNPRRFLADASTLATRAAWHSAGPTLLECLEGLSVPPSHWVGGAASSLLNSTLRFTVADTSEGGTGGTGGGGGLSSGGGADGGGESGGVVGGFRSEQQDSVSPSPSFSSFSSGLTVLGKVETGWICPGMNIVSWPSGARGKVKYIRASGGGGSPCCCVPCAGAGQCLEVGVGGFGDKGEVAASSILCWPGAQPNALLPVFKMKALIALRPGSPPIFPGQQFLLHSHCAVEACVVSRLLRTVKQQQQQQQVKSGAGGGGLHSSSSASGGRGGASSSFLTLSLKPRLLLPKDLAIVRIVLSRRACFTSFSENKRLGSFALRYHGRTVALGKILKLTR